MFKPLSFLRILALGLLVLPGIAAQAAAPVSNPPRITPELIAEIDALIPQEMSRFDIPGAALALIQDGAVVYARGFGYADMERGKPFTPDTLHRIGSTTQSMTSLLAAIQVERGILGWDTPIRLISPLYRFPTLELTKTLTVRQLLGMGTGLAQSPLEPYIDLQSPRNFLQTLNTLPIGGAAGSTYFKNDFVYASAGFLGLLRQGTRLDHLEQAYADLMKRELFDPIGMPKTAITNDPTTLGDNVARSYGYDIRYGERPNWVQPYLAVRMVGPASGAATTLNEMARYLITQLNGGVTPDGRRLVAQSLLDETHRGQTKISDTPAAAYAMGWVNVTDSNGIPTVGHRGSVDGFKTDMTMLTQGKIGILLFANADTGEFFNDAIRGRILEILYGLTATALGKQEAAYGREKEVIHTLKTAVIANTLPPYLIAPYVGCYERGWKVEYIDGLPTMTRADGVSLALLPTAQGFRMGSGTLGDGFKNAVTFIGDPATGQVRMLITNPANGTLIDNLARIECQSSLAELSTSSPWVNARCVLNYVEGMFPGFLPANDAPVTQYASSVVFRYYPTTRIYVGLSPLDNHLHYLGPDGILQDGGELASWLVRSSCL